MEPESLLVHLEVAVIYSYPEPDQTIQCPQSKFLIIRLNIKLRVDLVFKVVKLTSTWRK